MCIAELLVLCCDGVLLLGFGVSISFLVVLYGSSRTTSFVSTFMTICRSG